MARIRLVGFTCVFVVCCGPQSFADTLSEPIATAVRLLGWSGDVPRIELVAIRPGDASQHAEAWVRFAPDGVAAPIIYVRTDTHVYRDAARKNHQALVRLAGILAHERWHLRYGRDEVGAYEAQLLVMEYLRAGSLSVLQIRQALSRAQARKKSVAKAR